MYIYDYRILKPNQNSFITFKSTQGRKQPSQRYSNHSYQHYNYDNLEWNNRSSIFTNTKTHLIGFDKQISRYVKKNHMR